MATVARPRSRAGALRSGSPVSAGAVVAILLPSSPEPILLAPGLGAGCGTGPMALEKQVFPTPLGKHRGGEGKMEPFPLWDFLMSKESHPALWDMHRGGDNPASLGQVPGGVCP